MRMRFSLDDEKAFQARRDELGEQFARWLNAQKVPGDPNDAGLLMDWKVGYGDGALDRWTVADVSEFLLEWCPRKLSVPPNHCAKIPVSVAAFVEFLAHTGLLARRSDLPSQVRRFCERNTARFIREMGDPANFGMAKSLFGRVGGLEPGADRSPEGLAALIRSVEGLPPDVVGAMLGELSGDDDDDDDHAVVGPVRLPDEGQRRAAIRTAPAFRRLRLLAEYCRPPGRPLTGKGNLRLADARHLVAALETGDDPELGGVRKLQSADDLPGLSWLVRLALEAGAVRRQQGKLVAVARFADLDETAAYEKGVRAAVTVGLSGPPGFYFPALEPVRAVADECVVGLLADLLDAGPAGIAREALVDTAAELVDASFEELPGLVVDLVPRWARTQLERLEDLGVVSSRDEAVTLTPAGVPVAIELVADAGVEVLLRPDAATCDAAAIVDLLGAIDESDWTADASAWLTARPDAAAAAAELIDEVCAEGRDPVAVVAGLAATASACARTSSTSPVTSARRAACRSTSNARRSTRTASVSFQHRSRAVATRHGSPARAWRRVCSSRRRFVRAWASVESGQNRPAIRWRGCGTPAFTARKATSASVRGDRERAAPVVVSTIDCSPNSAIRSILGTSVRPPTTGISDEARR